MIPILAALTLATIALWRHLLPRLTDRFRRLDIPAGWTVDTLDEIRPHFHDNNVTEQVIELVGDELGLWAPELADPVPPVLFHTVRDEHPVDLSWKPGWTRDLGVAI